MNDSIADKFDLEIAWKRVKADHPDRVFLTHPFEFKLIELDLNGWLENLDSDLRNNNYRPSPMKVCDVPKGKGAIRPGAHLTVNDRIVYACCVGASFSYIHKNLLWSQGIIDFSYLLSDEASDSKWVKNPFDGWKMFEEQTLLETEQEVSHVVFTDITGYYENIILETLMSDLRQTGTPEEIVVQLSSMLNKWAEAPGRGIPQGHTPSDILAKVYLNTIDEALRGRGIHHLRYVDDFRILCRSESDAKVALMHLTTLLRKRGLSLQTAKTEILPVEQARDKVESITKTLLEVQEEYNFKVKDFYEMTGYFPFAAADEYVEETFSEEPNDAPNHVIHDAFYKYFVNSDEPFLFTEESRIKFDKTLFHYLLNRLGKAEDHYAVEYCLSLFSSYPEETEAILKYFERLGDSEEYNEKLYEFLTGEDSVYPYQKYQIMEWILRTEKKLNNELLSVVRELAFNRDQPPYLKCICQIIIGKNGTSADLEELQNSYSDAQSDSEQCDILCSLQNLETRRRNSFLSRVEGDSEMHRRAVRFIKNRND